MKISSTKSLFLILFICVLASVFVMYDITSIGNIEQQGIKEESSEIVKNDLVSIKPTDKQTNSTSADTQKKTYTLEERYVISREYNTCRAEINDFDARQDVIKSELDQIVDTTSDLQEKRSALLYANSVGLLNAQNLITKIKDVDSQLLLSDTIQLEVTENQQLEDLSGKSKELAIVVTEIFDFYEKNDFENGLKAIEIFSQLTNKKGALITSTNARNEQIYISAELMVGVLLNKDADDALADYLGTNGLSSESLFNPIMEGIEPEKLADYIDRFGFSNKAFVGVNAQLITPLQVAVDSEHLDLINLLVANINEDRDVFRELKAGEEVSSMESIMFSPINQVVRAQGRYPPSITEEPGKTMLFAETAELLTLLSKAGYPLLLTYNLDSFGEERLNLLGHESVFVSDQELIALERLGVEVIIVDKINSNEMSALSTVNRSVLSGLGSEFADISLRKADKALLCDEFEKRWLNSEPASTFVSETADYQKNGLSFSQQVEHLGSISPTLADLYYRESLRRDAHPSDNEVLTLIQSISYLSDVSEEFISRYQSYDPDLYLQDQLVTHLCNISGFEGAKLATEINAYFDIHNDHNACLSRNREWFRPNNELAPQIYKAANYSPGILFSLARTGNMTHVYEWLLSDQFDSSIDLVGRPHGRDALMLLLDRFSDFQFLSMKFSRVSDDMVYQILLPILEGTNLTEKHFTRLHRLKVANILLFERLAERVPAILDASNYPFSDYQISSL